MKAIPSLTTKGWIIETKDILEKILSYYILTDNGQSISFANNLINLPYTYFKNINDPEGMKIQIKNDLTTLLSRYFTISDIETKVKKNTESKFDILIYATIIDDKNNKIELGKILNIEENYNLKNIISINNFGTGVQIFNNI